MTDSAFRYLGSSKIFSRTISGNQPRLDIRFNHDGKPSWKHVGFAIAEVQARYLSSVSLDMRYVSVESDAPQYQDNSNMRQKLKFPVEKATAVR